MTRILRRSMQCVSAEPPGPVPGVDSGTLVRSLFHVFVSLVQRPTVTGTLASGGTHYLEVWVG